MNAHDKKKDQLRDGSGHQQSDTPATITRREFFQFSTFALMAAALPFPLTACGGGGGGDESGGNGDTKQVTLEQGDTGPGRLMGIQVAESPGAGNIPEDIFSVLLEVDQTIRYLLKPIVFREDWIGVLLPPMIQQDGSYFNTKEITVNLLVEGIELQPSSVQCNQDLAVAPDSAQLLSLLDDVADELEALDSEKAALFDTATVLASWEEMYPMARDALDYLTDIIAQVDANTETDVITIGGDRYVVTAQDISLAQLMLADLSNTRNMFNAFLELMPASGRDVALKLTALLSYAIPGAFLVTTRDMTNTASGAGIAAALLTAMLPAACMCIAGNSMKMTLADEDMKQTAVLMGQRWYASIFMYTGLHVIDGQMVCDFADDQAAALKFVTQDGVALLEEISSGYWADAAWSNNVPWNNTFPWNNTPWTNNGPWNNTIWTNQPWNHLAWDNSAAWNHTVWNNNIWTNATPWSNTTWSNTPPWSNAPPWSNTPVWNNAPVWANNTPPWNNTPAWSNIPVWANNTPWGNTPWGNNPWSNFVNSGDT